MSFEDTGIIFLEDGDFVDGILYYNGKRVTKGIWLIMVQGSFCGYCKQTKPKFVEAANRVGSRELGQGVIFATIHTDSKYEGDRKLAKAISGISGIPIPGIPAFLIYDAATRQFSKYDGKREVDDLCSFVSKMKL